MKVYVLIKEVTNDGDQFIDAQVYSTKESALKAMSEIRYIWEEEVYNTNPNNFDRYSSAEFYWMMNHKNKNYFKLTLQEREVL